MVSDHTLRFLIHFEFIFVYGVKKYSSFILYKWLTSFPSPHVKEIIFSLLYILASFVKDKMSIGVCSKSIVQCLTEISILISVRCSMSSSQRLCQHRIGYNFCHKYGIIKY